MAAGSFCLIDVLAVGHRHLHGSTALGERLNLWQSADDWDGFLGGLAGSRTDVNGPALFMLSLFTESTLQAWLIRIV